MIKMLFKKRALVSISVGLIVIGVGPIFLAEFFRKLGFDATGFGLMWGLNFGAFFTIAGILGLIFAGVAKSITPATKK